jgi:hypothetical protein
MHADVRRTPHMSMEPHAREDLWKLTGAQA